MGTIWRQEDAEERWLERNRQDLQSCRNGEREDQTALARRLGGWRSHLGVGCVIPRVIGLVG